jgi:hypothetical protein
MQANVKTFVKATGQLPELSLGGDLDQGGDHSPMDQALDDGPGGSEAEDSNDDDMTETTLEMPTKYSRHCP